MEFGRQWKVRASFGWIRVRVGTSADPPARLDSVTRERKEYARFQLFYELRRCSPAVLATLREVAAFVAGGSAGAGSMGGEVASDLSEPWALERFVDEELWAERLDLDYVPFWNEPLRERDLLEGPQPPPKPLPPPEDKSSFIAVSLLDQDGKPVVGRRWLIELPDGSKHSGVTDADGWARVRGFTQDGMAKVSFPEFDELDHTTKNSATQVIEPVVGEEPEEPPEEEQVVAEEPAKPEAKPAAASAPPAAGPPPPSLPLAPALEAAAEAVTAALAFVEFLFVDDDGKPVSDVPYVVKTADGKSFEGRSDSEGRVRVDGVSEGTCELELPGHHGAEWKLGA